MIPKQPLFKTIWFNNFDQALQDLATLAINENWDYQMNPTGRLPILNNYIHHTFAKVESDGITETSGEYFTFNTGLVTTNQEEIFGYCQNNKKPNATQKFYFLGWKKASERDLLKFTKLPDIANYFSDPSDLLYDLKIELRTNTDHIIQDNKARFPSSLSTMPDHQLGTLLQGTIEDAKKRIKRNYKTAIPQYYKGKLQLLLPLCLVERSKADLALVVEKENSIYRASTCLTLDMAINNARLIAKPDDEWLKP